MQYAAACEYLRQIQGENCKLSLDNVRRLIARAPVDIGACRYVQVAGSNGKGSTSHFIAAILKAAGWRVGLFTSPHLQDVRERIRVDGRPVSRRDFACAVSAARAWCERLLTEGAIANRATFFETLFLAALHHFARCRADWAVLEVGLGGRLDATSTVRPEVTVITNVSLEHTNVLGRTLEAIAREKAGVIRRGVPLVCGCAPGMRAAAVIRAAARRRRAPLSEVFAGRRPLTVEKGSAGYFCRYRNGVGEHRFLVRLKGRHQARNAAVAVAVVDALRRRGWEVGAAAIGRGIAGMVIPGRIETIGQRPPLILDGGHNRAGIQALVDFLREERIHGFTLLFGVLRDKLYADMARKLAPLAGRVVLSEPESPRALPAEKLRRYFPGLECRVEKDPARALAIAKKFKKTIIVCGSLYLVGAIRAVALGGKKDGRQAIPRSRKAV
ncbi:MAG: bifunctional folylpolyglutamate synthase/dihydrofolate synthase [Candidatus Aminicenantes bacterium]|nr:bifunctional folylpolyglutamate synthase/dihydrofolate synthase [Candidatus Aminicenantes bacterium]